MCKNSSKKKKTATDAFYKKCIKIISIITIVSIFSYIIVYCIFKGDGILSAGIELEKKDWLSFLGAYLSFIGTIIVSAIAVMQSKYINAHENDRRNEERKHQIQPIFSVSIGKKNTSLDGVAEVFSFNDSSTFPKHDNFTIIIENAGQFPITNVIVFEKYVKQILKAGEEIRLQCAYEDSPDLERKGNHLIELLLGDYEKGKNGLPDEFNIMYVDADGNDFYQTFRLKELDDTYYYTIEMIEQL